MVVTKEQLLEAYSADKIEPCKKPDTYYLNVNSKLFRTVGPFEYSENCKYPEESLNIPTVNKINQKMDSLTFSQQKLQQVLTEESVSSKQILDPKCAKMIAYLKTHDSDVYTLQNNILVRVNKNVTLPHLVYLPKSLVPFALAYFHYKTHSGVKKMLSLLKLNYF